MLEAIVKHEIIFYAMGILVVFGVLAKMISNITVRKMVKEAGDIHKSNHKLMRLVKAKFEHACMVSDKVQNVEAFVNKYIYEYKVLGMRVGSWSAIPQKSIWVVVALGVFAIFESYRMDGVGKLMYRYVQWTSIFSILLIVMCLLLEDKPRLQAAQNYMVEYLENVCSRRYEKMQQTVEEQKEEEEVVTEEVTAPKAEELDEEERKSEQEMRIRAILEEFLA